MAFVVSTIDVALVQEVAVQALSPPIFKLFAFSVPTRLPPPAHLIDTFFPVLGSFATVCMKATTAGTVALVHASARAK